jgi:hypothetical protein
MGIERRPSYLLDDAALAEWRWPNFTPAEFACRGSGKLLIVPAFMDRLQRLRNTFAKPMPITSGYRSPEHNRAVSSTGYNGPHTTGRAVDIRIAGEAADKLFDLAKPHGFTGRGIRQHGDWSGRFLHLDDLTAPEHPRPRIWSYP